MEGHGIRILHLDGLRGLAALAVVLCHYLAAMSDQEGIQHYIGHFIVAGWLGVDVFFTLSGFLITGILLNQKNKTNYFANFYVRRLFRLAPLYYAYLGLILIIEIVTHSVDGLNLAANALYLQNFYLAYLGHSVKGTGLLWSLAVEEQFYLVWPMVVYRLRPAGVVAFAVAAGLFSILLRAALCRQGFGFAAYILIVSHMDGLCIGALTALAVRNSDPLRFLKFLRIARWPSVAILLGLIAFCGDLGDGSRVFGPLSPVLVSVITAGAIVSPSRAKNLLESSALRWLGRYSYAIYVLQFLPGILIQHWLFQHTDRFILRMGGVGLIIAMVLLQARISWALIEGPMLRLRERIYPTNGVA